ncbi:outer membrane protein assembly factor BamD [Aurantibacter aestuarii]|uniref:Outer membrane protein assembly factor BamD n=1 Tax=Aurantibacter aestuarii TaxID=1266046 RepID=A0A2T1N985_9FLAO|nr:outer membrane protein assembly factor BamD [Aurantibacter aestuarii]PSG88436.1 outer membrane protein assembly factor BamD [Aurantibacter aestuarii]
MKNIFYIACLFLVLSSCSQYQKALKSEDASVKYDLGVKLYEEGKYKKANRLFEQIIPKYRGKPQAEKLMYLHASAFYELEDHYLAAYQFETFATAYPNSEKAEEASYKSAESYYQLSPVFSKDQTETYNALEKLQLFANIYPESQYLPKVNELVKELDFKLEKKAFEIAKQYNHISDYKASIKSFNNFLTDFPGSSFRNDAMRIRAEAAFSLAEKSVVWKQEERFIDAQKYYNLYKSAYPKSESSEETDMKLTIIEENLQQINSNKLK